MYLETLLMFTSLYEQLLREVQIGGGHFSCNQFEFKCLLYDFKETFFKMELPSCDMFTKKKKKKKKIAVLSSNAMPQKNYESPKLAIKIFYFLI